MKKLNFRKMSGIHFFLLAEAFICIAFVVCLVSCHNGAEDSEKIIIHPAKPQRVVAAEIEPTEPRYRLADAELQEVASVVTAEAGGEPFKGMMAVAQCILQACEDDGIRPTEAVVRYKYAKSRPEPTEDALEAVRAVFERGEVATAQPIKYFYAPALVYSEWHETQVYVMTIQGHKFFMEATK